MCSVFFSIASVLWKNVQTSRVEKKNIFYEFCVVYKKKENQVYNGKVYKSSKKKKKLRSDKEKEASFPLI